MNKQTTDDLLMVELKNVNQLMKKLNQAEYTIGELERALKDVIDKNEKLCDENKILKERLYVPTHFPFPLDC